MGLHHHGRPALDGVESQVDSTIGGRPPPTWEVGIPPLGGSPSWARFPPPMEGFGFGSYSKTWTPTLGIHLYNEGPREGAGHPKTTSWPPPIEWPATPPKP